MIRCCRTGGWLLAGGAHRLNSLAERMAARIRTGIPTDSERPVIVHNPAKVGSKTVVASLRRAFPHLEIHQTHYLSPAGLRRADERMAQLSNPFWTHIDECRALSRRIRAHASPHRWRVITLVRDPVARDISFFFHCLPFLLPDIDDRYRRGEVTVDDLLRLFIATIPDESPLHFVFPPTAWFQQEMEPVFGIDVYAESFPFEPGYKIYCSSRADLLVLRLESLTVHGPAALADFMDVPRIDLVPANTASLKRHRTGTEYYRLYDEFRRSIRFPPGYLDSLYGSRYARHFYSKKEIHSFRTEWAGNRHPTHPLHPESLTPRP